MSWGIFQRSVGRAPQGVRREGASGVRRKGTSRGLSGGHLQRLVERVPSKVSLPSYGPLETPSRRNFGDAFPALKAPFPTELWRRPPDRLLEAPSRPQEATSRSLEAPSRPLKTSSRPLDALFRQNCRGALPTDLWRRPPDRPLEAPSRQISGCALPTDLWRRPSVLSHLFLGGRSHASNAISESSIQKGALGAKGGGIWPNASLNTHR